MSKLAKRTKKFFKRLHEDETGPNTIEWVLLIIVALIVMAAIYYIVQWVLGGGVEEGKVADEQRKVTKDAADAIKTDLKTKVGS